MNGRIMRPDTRPHLIACPQPTQESACINGGIHTRGGTLKPLPKPEDGAVRYKARKADCSGCALKDQCTTAAARTVLRLINEPALERVARRLKAAPDLMAKCAQSVEPAFGTLKRWLHGGRFLLRGRDKAQTELGLLTLAFNLDRLTNLYGAAKMQAALA